MGMTMTQKILAAHAGLESVKAGDLTHDTAAFRAACEHLLARGAEVLILGCTELPPAFELYHLDYPNVDPTLELALGAIRAAGCETK